MARFLNLTLAIFRDSSPETHRVMLNIEHVVSVSELKPCDNYPSGGSIITMTSVTTSDGLFSETYYVRETVDHISRNLPI